jgi:hypothetical protein
MQNLYWMKSSGKTVNLVETPFESEAALEKYIFDNQELLEDVYIFKRQVRSGSHQGIPDMLGIDQDGRVCLIEVKNERVTESVLPQVLQYAVWAETSPDSVKALWLEAKERPEDIEINWDTAEIRLVIIGPSFRPNVIRLSEKIGYPVELLQVTRFVQEGETFVLVEQLAGAAEEKPAKATRGMEAYDWDFYVREHGKEAAEEMRRAVDEVNQLIKKQGWNMHPKLNKYYVAFKYGNTNPISIQWGGTHTWNVQVKVSQEEAEKLSAPNWQLQHYHHGWKQAVFRRTNERASATELESLFAKAYERIRGKA